MFETIDMIIACSISFLTGILFTMFLGILAEVKTRRKKEVAKYELHRFNGEI